MSIPSTGAFVAVYRPPDFDLVATPITHHGITYRPEKNAPGSGGVTITLDDPAYPDIQINDVVAIRRDGDTDVLMWDDEVLEWDGVPLEWGSSSEYRTVAAVLIERIDEHTLDTEGGARQVAGYSGRLVGAFLEWAVIAPALGDRHKPIEDDAVFDWRSPRYNPAGDPWEASTQILTVTAAKAGGWPTTPMGQDFTDSTGAYMIWHSSGNASTAPEGTCLFYIDIDITSPGRHGLEVLMDNDGYVWVDGVEQLQIDQTEGYHRASFRRIFLSDAVHRFTFQVRNFDGPAALAFNLFKTDHQDRPMPGVAVVAKSTSTVKVLEYPVPFPGMTVGEILEDLIAEAITRGALTWLVTSFSNTLDSDGAAWDREVGITTKTGTTTLLQFLDELVASERVSRWRLRPDGVTLDVYAPGYSTRPASVELQVVPVTDPNTGQVHTLDRVIT